MVPRAEPASYYGRPVIKPPVWTWEIPCYLFTGGLAGASAALGSAASAAGNRPLARRAWLVAFAGVTASPVLLVADLGRPERFLNMLRMFKLTSPMSVGSWILTASGAATALATAHELFGWFRRVGPLGKAASPILGPALATYIAVLFADTAVPVWHEGHRELPFVFAGSAMASAGAAAVALTPRTHAGPARRLSVAGAALELAAAAAMQRRVGDLGEPLRTGRGGRFARTGRALTAAGASLIALRSRRTRAAAVLGGAAVLVGALGERWAMFEAGKASAADPKYTVAPQRERLETSDQL
jgi:hypothetical protein